MSSGLLPPLFTAAGTDEFRMPSPGPRECLARARAAQGAAACAHRLEVPLARHLAARTGTAAALRAIDAAAGGGYYAIPPEAEQDPAAAEEALGGEEVVVDVQTHFVASGRTRSPGMQGVLAFIREVAPERFAGLQRGTSLCFAEYLRCLFLESETAVAVLTAAPGAESHNILPNAEIQATQEILNRTAGSGRLLHHAIVHPEVAGEIDGLEALVSAGRPAGFKVYTLYGSPGHPGGWMLDDPEVGLPFLERSRALGVPLVCAHKGLSGLAPTGSPRDVGPAALAFPDLQLLVYHAGYELPADENDEEGAYGEAQAGRGTNRLVHSLRRAGIGPGANVHAELGSTWAVLLRHPHEAAHVLGKLLLAVGEDNLLWGTDSVWYGPAQPLIDAFRAFQIPEALCERHGYPVLTAERKAKILGRNAARLYGIDLAAAGARARADEFSWVAAALREARQRGIFDAGSA